MRRLMTLVATAVLMATPARALDIVQNYIPEAAIVGEGRLSLVFWDIYDAKLFAPQGKWDARKPFALSIHYLRDIDKNDIAARTIHEMRAQGFTDEIMLATWYTQLKGIFPNVHNGTVLTALFLPEQGISFFKESQALGNVRGQQFSKLFFDIWLGEKTSEPALRRKLLGLS